MTEEVKQIYAESVNVKSANENQLTVLSVVTVSQWPRSVGFGSVFGEETKVLVLYCLVF